MATTEEHPGANSLIRTSMGDCNGVSGLERWEKETPVFARQIATHIDADVKKVVEYGCGIGRLAKAVLALCPEIDLVGVDDSVRQLNTALAYVNEVRFEALLPQQFEGQADLIYSVYVLQHTPAVELREALHRIYSMLKPGGKFIYCGSEVRMAVCFDKPRFFNDGFLGVNVRKEIERFFEPQGDLFPTELIATEEILQRIVLGMKASESKPQTIPHPAIVYRRREIEGPLFNAPRVAS
jgi:SAM-dependent methyltransferase